MTVGRSDYGIFLPVLRRIESDPTLRLQLLVAGAHLSPEFGDTAQAIEQDGFVIDQRVEMLLSSDSPLGTAKSMGLGVLGFAEAYAQRRPDLLVVLGDRFEMHAAALTALPFKIPVAHIHGGELSQGAIDDALRHSITKLSHLHFVSTEDNARRVRQLGEEPWRVTVSGAPSLDHLRSGLLDRQQLEARFGLRLDPPPLLVTFHPVTLEFERTEWQVGELLAALDESGLPVVFTMPNADTSGRTIARRIREFAEDRPSAFLIQDAGAQAYWSLMAAAAAVVGNSSSGIVEAPSVKVPVVNVGSRQEGRLRAANVIDVGYGRAEVLAGIRKAVDRTFRAGLKDLQNPYGKGCAADVIVDRLRSVALDERLIRKRFIDVPVPAREGA